MVKYMLLFLVALFFLWISFRGVSWRDFVDGLNSANFYWIGASMGASVMAFWFRALRWHLVMRPLGSDISRLDAWDGVNIGYITNFMLPRAGEIARCGVISKKRGLSFEKVAGTVVLERSVDMLSLLLATILLLIFGKEVFTTFFEREILTKATGNVSALLIISAVAALFAFALGLIIIYRYKERYSLLKKIDNLLKGLLEGLLAGFRMKSKGLFFLYTLAIWVCYWLMSYTTILAFPAVLGLGPYDALFLMVVGGFGWVIPVQGGIGAYHFVISLALTTIYSIEPTSSVIFATISHESQAITMILFGGISLISLYLRKKQ